MSTVRPQGRPIKLMTDEGRDIVESLVQSFRCGLFTKQACSLAGISMQAYRVWQRKGRDAELREEHGEELTEADEVYLAFMGRVMKARAIYSKLNMTVIQQASIGRVPGGSETKPDWKAAAWLQERCFPQEYGPLNQHRVEMNQSIELEINNVDANNPGTALLFDVAQSLGLAIVSGNVFPSGSGITDQSDDSIPELGRGNHPDEDTGEEAP